MLPLLWRGFSGISRQNGSTSKWLRGILATPILRKYRLSGGCPINLQAGIHFDNLSRLFRPLPLSIVHLLSRCNSSLRDSRLWLARGRGTNLVLVSNVARRATMLGSAHRPSLHSLLILQLTLVWLSGQLLRRKYPSAVRGRSTSLRLTRSCRMNP